MQFLHSDCDAKLLKIDKKDHNEIDIYYIGYVTVEKIDNCNNTNKKNKNKYLFSYDVDEKNKILIKHKEVWEGVKKEIETTNGGKKIEYGKDF